MNKGFEFRDFESLDFNHRASRFFFVILAFLPLGLSWQNATSKNFFTWRCVFLDLSYNLARIWHIGFYHVTLQNWDLWNLDFWGCIKLYLNLSRSVDGGQGAASRLNFEKIFQRLAQMLTVSVFKGEFKWNFVFSLVFQRTGLL